MAPCLNLAPTTVILGPTNDIRGHRERFMPKIRHNLAVQGA